jgi:hypothetical protein
MPKEELRFLWKISLVLFAFGSGRRPAKLGVEVCKCTPISEEDNVASGDTDRNDLWEWNRAAVSKDLLLSLSIPKDSGSSIGGTGRGGVEKCKEFGLGPDNKGGAGCLQNEVAFSDLIPDFAAAC